MFSSGIPDLRKFSENIRDTIGFLSQISNVRKYFMYNFVIQEYLYSIPEMIF